jgi:type I restriction enzyme S subunit
MSEWTCKSVGLRIIELPKSVFPAGMAEDIGSYPFFCSSPVVKKINHWLHDGNTILMGTGGVATVHYGQNRFAYSTDTWAFTVADSATNISFLFRQFEHKLKQIEYFGFEGSGLKHLQKEYIRKLELLTPPLNEQNVVVKVLDTIDTAIQQTQAIINKLKQLKQGLLHDLLTRGVDAKGELRPCYEDAPHLYKESPLGWIPKEWEVKELAQLLGNDEPSMRSGPFGSALLKSELVEAGIPLLGIDNVHVEYFDNRFSRFVTAKKFYELARYAVRPNDLMITIMGTVGRCCLVPSDIGTALSSKHTWTITLNPNLYSPYLAMLQINYSPWALDHFSKGEQGGIMSAIRSDTLRTLILPTPPITEQKEIASRLLNISERISLEIVSVKKLQMKKTALMDDLLTGRVRVTSLLQPEASSA